jgi:hypothetical protein
MSLAAIMGAFELIDQGLVDGVRMELTSLFDRENRD